ncbi:putative transposase [Stenotrophomonas rhizophila]|uniref:Putative transposase n=1 Tax=Stenotrophomonas rhizophila TaxID=216778 RepID=A0A498CI39_9GAMM|nr:putative transposase [Stenotrophomonas rhizophila]
MRTSKFTETQIITILKQGDAGLAVKDLCCQAGMRQCVSPPRCTRAP